jgi:hypothetical protein
MLAGARSVILFCFLFAATFAAVLPVQAQTNGASPSVTSMGFGGRFMNGVSPSVTSLGTNSYSDRWSVFGSCCANFVWPALELGSSSPFTFLSRQKRQGMTKIRSTGTRSTRTCPMVIRPVVTRPTGTRSSMTQASILARGIPILPSYMCGVQMLATKA